MTNSQNNPVEAPSALPPNQRDSAGQSTTYTYRGEGTGWSQAFLWRIGRVFFQFIAVLLFHVRISGREHVPAKGGALLATNHQSMLDPWMIGIALKRQIHYMARESLFRGGVVQYLFERTNAFPIRRGRADSGAMRDALARLEKGYLVNIFPEATRTTDGSIGAVAAGVAIIVRRARVPVIPVVVEGAFEAWPRGRKLPRPSPIRIRYGPPIPFSELAELSPDDIALRIRREFIKLQGQLRSAHTGQSIARLEADLQAGKKRLVVSRELAE